MIRLTPFAILVAVLAGCAPSEELPPASVLLVSLDSVRQDLLGAYGRTPAHAPGESPSPRLDALAAEGVLFEDAYATTSWTLPSHASLFTGSPEVVHGVETSWARLGEDRPTLAEVLRARGYRTAAFYSGPYLDPRYGLDRGFDLYEERYGDELARAAERERFAWAALRAAERAGDAAGAEAARSELDAVRPLVERLSHRDRSSERVADAAIEELRAAAASEGPFFLFLHFFDPHYDYAPPEEYAERFDPEYDGDFDGEGWYTRLDVAPPDPESPSGRRRAIGDRDLAHAVALYEGELAWTDSQIGRVLDELERLGLAEDTLVVVTADHGDEFFEHGGIGHRRTLHDEVLRVPLLARLPGRLPAGERVRGLATLAEVAPTVLDVLDVPAPRELSERSLIPLVRGEEGAGGRGAIGRLVRWNDRRFFATETWREGDVLLRRQLVWEAGSDPGSGAERIEWVDLERHPEAPEEGFTRELSDPRARAALESFRARYAELLGVRAGSSPAAAEGEPTAALRGLGYADDAPEPEGALVLPPPGG